MSGWTTPIALVLVAAALAALVVVWRVAAWPCPSWLVPLLENPYFQAVAGADRLIRRADVRPGMRVLDAGCGPGRLTLPLAHAVGAHGSVTALDVQPSMLERLRARLDAERIDNVETVEAGLGDGRLPRAAFDRALLVTVLGEIPDKPRALREIFEALRPGGLLSVTEVLPDPHYQRLARVEALGREAGFEPADRAVGWVSFTLALVKPASPPSPRSA